MNNKGIDWSKKDIYDGIGRPDLKIPKEEEVKMSKVNNFSCYECGFSFDLDMSGMDDGDKCPFYCPICGHRWNGKINNLL